MSLPFLVSVCHHGCPLGESRNKISSRAKAPFSLCCTTYVATDVFIMNISESLKAMYRVSWRLAIKTYLEFVVSYGTTTTDSKSRWRQKSEFPQCQLCSLVGFQPSRSVHWDARITVLVLLKMSFIIINIVFLFVMFWWCNLILNATKYPHNAQDRKWKGGAGAQRTMADMCKITSLLLRKRYWVNDNKKDACMHSGLTKGHSCDAGGDAIGMWGHEVACECLVAGPGPL